MLEARGKCNDGTAYAVSSVVCDTTFHDTGHNVTETVEAEVLPVDIHAVQIQQSRLKHNSFYVCLQCDVCNMRFKGTRGCHVYLEVHKACCQLDTFF